MEASSTASIGGQVVDVVVGVVLFEAVKVVHDDDIEEDWPRMMWMQY